MSKEIANDIIMFSEGRKDHQTELAENYLALEEKLKAARFEEAKAKRVRDYLKTKNKELEDEVHNLGVQMFRTFNEEECWIYQGDGSDYLESLVCPVVISPKVLLELEQENERLREVAKAVGSINRSRNHIVPESVTGDDEPCYWQRKEWIDWIVDLADKALRGEEV